MTVVLPPQYFAISVVLNLTTHATQCGYTRTMAICSFCEADKKLTREHIWSDGVLRLFEPEAKLTFDDFRKLVHGDDPVIKDLCGDCNGGLSAADSEAIRFTDQYRLQPIALNGVLTCNAELLKHWALKTASNHERSHPRGISISWWRPYRSALRGLQPLPSDVLYYFAAWEDKSPIATYARVE
jgi:hypothetical protein